MVIFGTIYYICSYAQTIPQIVKLIKTKSSEGYSLWQILLGLLGDICWEVYIFTSSQALIVYIGTVVDSLLLFTVSFLIWKYHDNRYSGENEDKQEGNGDMVEPVKSEVASVGTEA